MQQLAAAAHQALTPGEGLVAIDLKRIGQLLQGLLLLRRQDQGRLAQLARQKGAEALATALQIGKTALGFEMQSLLQRPQPGLKRQLGGGV
jgi:hypothetical protein